MISASIALPPARVRRLAAGFRSSLVVAGCAIALSCASWCQGQLFDPNLPDELTENEVFQRDFYTWSQRAYPLGYIPAEARARALGVVNSIPHNSSGPPQKDPIPVTSWIPIGPAPILGGQVSPPATVSGRVKALAVDPGNPNHWLMGAAQGGIWSSTDAGANWIPLTDDQPSMAMGAIAFAPNNGSIVYAGTGEAALAGDAYAGQGLLKSTNGGVTWFLLASNTFAQSSFSHIRVHPTDPNTLVAGTAFGLAGRSGDFPPNTPPMGIFNSTDGGVTWTIRLKGQGTGLDVDPTNFNNQYAALGYLVGAAVNGVYRSTDGGNTWSLIAGPWAQASVGRTEIAVSPSAPATVYVSIQDTATFSSLGVWRTDNAWDPTPTWTQLPAIPAPGDQFWYDHVIIVDPTNPNILYLGETPLWKYDGTAWSAIGGDYDQNVFGRKIHPDQHAMAWMGSSLIVGNDGGVWVTPDGGTTFTNRNNGLATLQFYEGSLHPSNPNKVMAGAQDNGTSLRTNGNSWAWILFGDGCDNAFSLSNPDTDWAASSQGMSIFRTKDAGNNWIFAAGGILGFVPFVGRFEESPNNSDIFIAGSDPLYKSTNFFSASAAPTWTVNGPSLGAIPSALAFAPSDGSSKTYAFGTDRGNLRITTDGGSTWIDLDPGNTVPDRAVTGISFSSSDPNILYVSLSGFDEGTPGQPGHVFCTTNALSATPTWSDRSTPVNIPHNTIVVDPQDSRVVYVGTDLAVWKTIDSGNSWTFLGPATGLPNVAVYELKISRVLNRLVAFTHGRSAWYLPIGVTGTSADLFVTMRGTPNPVILGSNLTYTITVGNNGPLTATNVVMNQSLPNYVTFVSATSSQGTVLPSGSQITANIGNLPSGGLVTITVVVTPNQTGTFVSTASVSSSTADADLLNNSATVSSHVILPTAELALGLTAAPNPVLVGGSLVYSIAVTNRGPSTATGLTVSNSLPASVGITSINVSQGTTIVAGNVVLFNFGNLANGARATGTITVQPGSQGTIVATSKATANEDDPLPSNNSATVSTLVSPAANLGLGIIDFPDPVIVGSNLTYVTSITNFGPSTATSVILNQNIPATLVLVSSNTSQGSISVSGNSLSANLGSLSVGGKATVTLILTTTTNTVVTSSVNVSAAEFDVNTANNSATAVTVVTNRVLNIITDGAKLTYESIVPNNGTVDPGETVSNIFYLRNAGNVPNTNLVATLLPGGGVNNPSGPRNYGVLAPSGFSVGQPFSFTASGVNGGTVLATFQLKDGPNILSNVTFTFYLPRTTNFFSTNVIVIPDSGIAAPYPSTLTVSGVTGLVGKVTATLSDFTHSYPHDVSVLLVGPTNSVQGQPGAKTILMSHAADQAAVGAEHLTISFDDSVTDIVPDTGSLGPGPYHPAAYPPVLTNHPFDSTSAAALSVFSGVDPSLINGVWSLYVLDDAAGDSGGISNGWSLAVTTIVPVSQLPDIGLSVAATVGPLRAGDDLTYVFTVTNAGPGLASGVAFTNVLPASVTLVSAIPSQGSCATNGGVVVGNLNSIPAGATATVTILVRPNVAGSLTNTASVLSREADPHPANNTASAVTSIILPNADVAISETASTNSVAVGGTLTYTIVVTNRGPENAVNVFVTDPLPAALGSATASLAPGLWTNQNGVITANLGILTPASSATFTITAIATNAALATNTVSVAASSSSDPDLSNNSASVTVNIIAFTPVIINVGALLNSENKLQNGAIDPGETVTVSLSLANVGSQDCVNLVGALNPYIGGITNVSSPQYYGPVIHGGPSVARNFSFTALNPVPGGVIVAHMGVFDQRPGGANVDLGEVTFTFNIPATNAYFNTSAIAIPDHGPGNPYPSVITISNLPGVVSKAVVTLNGLNHTFVRDVNALLVNPSGGNVKLMSHTGGAHAVNNVTLTFDDDAAQSLPNAAQITNGLYKPTSYLGSVVFNSPAPNQPYGSAMNALNNVSPNGAWSLYILDDASGDSGNIANGWSLTLSTISPLNPVADRLSLSRTAAGLSLLNLSGLSSHNYQIQVSTNLTTWTTVFSGATAPNGTLQYNVTNSLKRQFYRSNRLP